MITIQIPILLDGFSNRTHGFASSRVECDLADGLAETFKRLIVGSRETHQTYDLRGKPTHVETGPDLLRHICEQARRQLEEMKDGNNP